ncbi:hypothetical protein ACVWZ4_007474 [Bradyrhizobium sp. USDA 4472]
MTARYADDFVTGFESKADAQEMLLALKARLASFGLTLHENKTPDRVWPVRGPLASAARRAATGDLRLPRLLSENLSGARFDRPQLRKAIAALGKGDVLIITRLDRLARSSRDLLNILHEVSESGAAFKSLADAWADTTTPHGKMMVTIPGGLSEFERSLIKARTDVGIRRAREAGEVRSTIEVDQASTAAGDQAARCRRAAERGSAAAQCGPIDDQPAGRARQGNGGMPTSLDTIRGFGRQKARRPLLRSGSF